MHFEHIKTQKLSFLVVWLRFILICLNALVFVGFDGFWLCFGQQRMVHKTWDDGKEQNCCQDYKTFPLLTTSKSIIINYSHGVKKTCIWRSSWIPTKKLNTRTNVSAFILSWTLDIMYVMADIQESVPNSVKPIPCHDKNRIHNGKCEDQSTGFIFLVSFLLIMIMNVNQVKIYVL